MLALGVISGNHFASVTNDQELDRLREELCSRWVSTINRRSTSSSGLPPATILHRTSVQGNCGSQKGDQVPAAGDAKQTLGKRSVSCLRPLVLPKIVAVREKAVNPALSTPESSRHASRRSSRLSSWRLSSTYPADENVLQSAEKCSTSRNPSIFPPKATYQHFHRHSQTISLDTYTALSTCRQSSMNTPLADRMPLLKASDLVRSKSLSAASGRENTPERKPIEKRTPYASISASHGPRHAWSKYEYKSVAMVTIPVRTKGLTRLQSASQRVSLTSFAKMKPVDCNTHLMAHRRLDSNQEALSPALGPKSLSQSCCSSSPPHARNSPTHSPALSESSDHGYASTLGPETPEISQFPILVSSIMEMNGPCDQDCDAWASPGSPTLVRPKISQSARTIRSEKILAATDQLESKHLSEDALNLVPSITEECENGIAILPVERHTQSEVLSSLSRLLPLNNSSRTHTPSDAASSLQHEGQSEANGSTITDLTRLLPFGPQFAVPMITIRPGTMDNDEAEATQSGLGQNLGYLTVQKRPSGRQRASSARRAGTKLTNWFLHKYRPVEDVSKRAEQPTHESARDHNEPELPRRYVMETVSGQSTRGMSVVNIKGRIGSSASSDGTAVGVPASQHVTAAGASDRIYLQTRQYLYTLL